MHLRLPHHFVSVLAKIVYVDVFDRCHRLLLSFQFTNLFLYILDRLLAVSRLFDISILLVVVAEVARVQKVILDRIVVLSQTFDVVWPDKPSLVVFYRHHTLDMLQVVICWQV